LPLQRFWASAGVVTTEHGDVARLKRLPTVSGLVINDKDGRIVTCENDYPDVTAIDTILVMDHSATSLVPAIAARPLACWRPQENPAIAGLSFIAPGGFEPPTSRL
jgi:hypothetical protein